MKPQIIKTRNLFNPDFELAFAKYTNSVRVKTPDRLLKYLDCYKSLIRNKIETQP